MSATLTEGPLGFPMPDALARRVEGVLRALPHTSEYEYRKAVTAAPAAELAPGERADISWISTESPDRTREAVRAAGMDDSQFRANPVVTLGHDYTLPPVGKSVWRKRASGPGGLWGVRAKTHYPPAPPGWPAGSPWLPDSVFALIQAGLLAGKSVGFIPLKVHVPDEKEAQQNGWAGEVRLVIDEWLLLEYACVTLPANQDALVEVVAKGALELPAGARAALGLPERVVGFTPLEEVEKMVRRRLAEMDVAGLAARALAEGLERARGRV